MRILSVVLFSIGLLLGMALVSGTLWADFEAYFFDAPTLVDEPLKTLHCPVMIAPEESGTVWATFPNPSDKTVPRRIRTHISQGFATLMREIETELELEPGETEKVEWTVTADDAAWGHFILVRVHVLRNVPLPSRSGACGILVLNVLGLTGRWLVILSFALSLLTMVIGIFLWARRWSPAEQLPDLTRPMIGLAAIVLAALVTSYLGSWVAGGLLLALALIVTISVVTWAVTRAT
jgi:hypothetical protein